jgi:hypothetical protein
MVRGRRQKALPWVANFATNLCRENGGTLLTCLGVKNFCTLLLAASLSDNLGKPFGKVTVLGDDRPHDGLDLVFCGPFVKACGALPAAVPWAVFVSVKQNGKPFWRSGQPSWQSTKTRSDDSWIAWTSYIRPQKTRDLIARIAPIREDKAKLQEELRKAQEALERKTAGLRKKEKNEWLYRNLTPEERRERQREDQRESARKWRQRRKEEAKAKAEQGQPIAILPQQPTQE